MSVDDRYSRFRRLHGDGVFVIPNPWDAGTAKYFAAAGFAALATTSAGLAFALGRPDSPTALSRDVVLENIRHIVDATPLPVSADFQAGYGASATDVRSSVDLCIDAGVAGLSIEDATGDEAHPLYSVDDAVSRLKAARAAIDASGKDVILTGRAECFLVGTRSPLDETIARLRAYSAVGADCLFAPGLRTQDEVRAVVEAVTPKPVNVLVSDYSWMTVESLARLGVRRISVGSAFARRGWAAVMHAASTIKGTGSFAELSDAEPFANLNEIFGGSGLS